MAKAKIPKNPDRDGTIPISLGQFRELRRAWYAIGDLGTLLKETRTDTVSNPQYIIRAIASELGTIVTELEGKFEKAKGGVV